MGTKFIDNSASYLRRIKYAKKRTLKASGELVTASAQVLAPRDTGQLAATISPHSVSENETHVGSGLAYAIFQERGTGEFALDGGRKGGWVYPVPGKYDDKGRQMFRKTYGVPPLRYLETAFEDNTDNVRLIAEKYFSQIK